MGADIYGNTKSERALVASVSMQERGIVPKYGTAVGLCNPVP